MSLPLIIHHIWYIDPVIGSVRARQDRLNDRERNKFTNHGDASFSGHCCHETFQMSQTRDMELEYHSSCNQIGFTTDNPKDSRSTSFDRYSKVY